MSSPRAAALDPASLIAWHLEARPRIEPGRHAAKLPVEVHPEPTVDEPTASRECLVGDLVAGLAQLQRRGGS